MVRREADGAGRYLFVKEIQRYHAKDTLLFAICAQTLLKFASHIVTFSIYIRKKMYINGIARLMIHENRIRKKIAESAIVRAHKTDEGASAAGEQSNDGSVDVCD